MSLTLAERIGLAIQKQRQASALSQTQLARMARLSLKYIGEIERGDANISVEALERLSVALEWDPFEIPLREQDTLPEGMRTLLLAELTHMQHLVQIAIGWVQTLDAAMVRRVSQPAPMPAQVRPGGPATEAQGADYRSGCVLGWLIGREIAQPTRSGQAFDPRVLRLAAALMRFAQKAPSPPMLSASSLVMHPATLSEKTRVDPERSRRSGSHALPQAHIVFTALLISLTDALRGDCGYPRLWGVSGVIKSLVTLSLLLV